MILADTSVWVDHLSRGVAQMAAVLNDGEVATHPFIVGELACGRIQNRREILELLQRVPLAPVAADAEVLLLIERHRLWGRGLGYIDMHLLASVMLGDGVRLWTRDKRLRAVASALRLEFNEK